MSQTKPPPNIHAMAAENHLKQAGNDMMSLGSNLQDISKSTAAAGAMAIASGTDLRMAAETLMKALTTHQAYMDEWLEKFIIAKSTRD